MYTLTIAGVVTLFDSILVGVIFYFFFRTALSLVPRIETIHFTLYTIWFVWLDLGSKEPYWEIPT